ncbi:hypothetical protein NON00_09800 [Roseomonas sp. GC11]|uniref:hypothetical protein n=1 Tax=Roseomonas sp. GC11 TaxID=2950546 RepID=UPI0021099363|nr:hypothetical protein [Roseomonas sp. GC11]MCQ4160220.1 hypothetical protein [Roseomonas sp. GC11]
MDMDEALRLCAANMRAQSHRLLAMARQMSAAEEAAEAEAAAEDLAASALLDRPAVSGASLDALRISHQLLGEAIALLDAEAK